MSNSWLPIFQYPQFGVVVACSTHHFHLTDFRGNSYSTDVYAFNFIRFLFRRVFRLAFWVFFVLFLYERKRKYARTRSKRFVLLILFMIQIRMQKMCVYFFFAFI